MPGGIAVRSCGETRPEEKNLSPVVCQVRLARCPVEAVPREESIMNVLIVAPAGYVGRKLLARLEQEASAQVRVLVGDARRIQQDLGSSTTVVEGDLLDLAVLSEAVEGIEIAYYPIRFAALDRGVDEQIREFARRFRDACIEAGVKRIIHLGTPAGWGRASRLQVVAQNVTEILTAYPNSIQTICLSPGIIIGPGSAFYEMVMALVRQLPVLFLPRWTQAEVRPLALSDAVEYLVHAASLAVTGSLTIEIGAPRIRVADLLRAAARITGRSRMMIPLPVTMTRFSAVCLTFATPFSYPVSLELVRTLNAVRQWPPESSLDRADRALAEISPLSCEEALVKALAATDAHEVEGRWTDSLAGISYRASESAMLNARYRDMRQEEFGDTPPSKVFLSVLSLGGEAGWFRFDILWRIRGLVDKALGGFGTSLGRRSTTDLRTGDMLDVWRVVDLVENERVLLEAQMNVFGTAWLEFRLHGTKLIQTAYYEPSGFLGFIYWYAMLPFHGFIFPDMVRSLVRRAQHD
jgi:nucleoside-diphosphate-sugar epimerase